MFLKIKRKTKYENRYHKKMGRLKVPVVRIKVFFFGLFPIKTLHEYRKTYYGEVKDLEDCKLSK